jgi:hypothetical protein
VFNVLVHRKIQIGYDEDTNRWEFEQGGREYTAESLAKAREDLDKLIDKQEKKNFQRIAAWHRRGWNHPEFQMVEVTSIGPHHFGPPSEAWIAIAGRREKVRVDSLYKCTPELLELIKQSEELKQQRVQVEAQLEAQMKQHLLVIDEG